VLTKQKLAKRDLRKILEGFDLGKILKAESMLTSGNITYLIKAEKGEFVLRLCPEGPRFRSKKEIAAELKLIDYLLKNNFPAPTSVLKKAGQRIVGWKEKFGYLRKFDNGKADLKPSIAKIKKFGETIGWFHNLICNFKTKNKREHIFDLKETEKYFRLNKNFILKSNFKKAKEFVEKTEKELSQMNFPKNLPSGTIHEDLGKRHILWKKNEISCILDFDRCYYGKLVLDLGEACRGWCFTDNWSKWSNKNFQVLISGYQSRRKLTKLEKKYFLAAVKFVVIERGIAFCLRFIKDTQDPEDEEYALKNIFYLTDILEKNKKKISNFLKL
jgi:Ser/Thr protein kinase RdoA (MazF antagonist)